MNSSETMETRSTTSWMPSAPPKASMRLPNSTVMNGIAAPLATAPSVPSSISAASALSANANSLWNGTRDAVASAAAPARSPLASPLPPLPPPFPGGLESDGPTAADALASASLQDSGMATVPPRFAATSPSSSTAAAAARLGTATATGAPSCSSSTAG
uniref:Uncharacterized protein n=1 Tax=Oryza brachyantha TaxID=4533 RepID=J3KYY7_ORYBR